MGMGRPRKNLSVGVAGVTAGACGRGTGAVVALTRGAQISRISSIAVMRATASGPGFLVPPERCKREHEVPHIGAGRFAFGEQADAWTLRVELRTLEFVIYVVELKRSRSVACCKEKNRIRIADGQHAIAIERCVCFKYHFNPDWIGIGLLHQNDVPYRGNGADGQALLPTRTTAPQAQRPKPQWSRAQPQRSPCLQPGRRE